MLHAVNYGVISSQLIPTSVEYVYEYKAILAPLYHPSHNKCDNSELVCRLYEPVERRIEYDLPGIVRCVSVTGEVLEHIIPHVLYNTLQA
jgi:hypothetical protein